MATIKLIANFTTETPVVTIVVVSVEMNLLNVLCKVVSALVTVF